MPPASRNDIRDEPDIAGICRSLRPPVDRLREQANALLDASRDTVSADALADLDRIVALSRQLSEQIAHVDRTAPRRSLDAKEMATWKRQQRHDLRTPINGITGYGEMLFEDWQDSGDSSLTEGIAALLFAAGEVLEQIALVLHLPGDDETETEAGEPPLKLGTEFEDRAGISSSANILVAEDNETNRHVLAKQLRRLGVEAVFARDGVEAWQALQSGEFSLLITDCQMPNMDGFALTSNIRNGERPNGPTLPIIALTAAISGEEADRCIAAGMNAFIGKPVHLAELDAALRRWLPADGGSANDQDPPSKAPIAVSPTVLDVNVITEIFGQFDDSTVEALHFFLDTTRPSLAHLRDQLEADDADGARATAHGMAGAARMAGAITLGAACSALEAALHDGNIGTVSSLADEIELAFLDVEHAIINLFRESDGENTADGTGSPS